MGMPILFELIIYVINVGGYIGQSTRLEIEYALGNG